MTSASNSPGYDHDVHAAAHALSDKFLQCRDLGHRWTIGGVISRDTNGFFHRPLRCTNCTTKRIDRMSPAGFVYGRTYEYPDGYALVGLGHKVHNRTAFRRVMLERVDYIDLDQED